MIRPISRRKRKPSPTPQYELTVTLCEFEPEIWRRLVVPGNATFGWLHAVIQVAMGWTNSHLHQFPVGEQVISNSTFELDDLVGSPRVLDEDLVTLMEIAPQKGILLPYEYDFGDSWDHLITVEDILDPDPEAARVARCLDGAGACPPEDCGGLPGYADLIKILRQPKHKAMKEWLGRPFDPDAFDVEATNTFLRKLNWPRVTVDQLANVLMERDGQ